MLCENLESVWNTKHSEPGVKVVTSMRNSILSTVNILIIETQVTTVMTRMEVGIPEGMTNIYNSR